ncbi:unnamed protein product [Rhizoctonia solani]|uniref:Uncharacterized protein n=1 Tax=Rhizoctonia solani TaxID=456999 RepID=A0A8H3GEB5_9AGAM|nr:unnamed protein product [Rhizoctonia solani]
MPKLHLLEIQTRGSIFDPLALGNLVEAAPGIETFDCGLTVQVLVILSRASRLRTLVVNIQSWIASAFDQDYEANPTYEDCKNVVSLVAQHCGRLESFESVDGFTGGIWEVTRDNEGKYKDVVNVY